MFLLEFSEVTKRNKSQYLKIYILKYNRISAFFKMHII